MHVYDGHGGSSELAVLDSLHSAPITFIEVLYQAEGGVNTSCFHYAQYNHRFETTVSADQSGMLEYWSGPGAGYSFPKNVHFEHKLDTDLYEFVRVSHCSSATIHLPILHSGLQHKATPLRLTFSPNGKVFVVLASDRKVGQYIICH